MYVSRYATPTAITAAAQICGYCVPAALAASLANPMKRGKTVPPKSPMIIRPDTSFFFSGAESIACEKTMEKTLELP